MSFAPCFHCLLSRGLSLLVKSLCLPLDRKIQSYAGGLYEINDFRLAWLKLETTSFTHAIFNVVGGKAISRHVCKSVLPPNGVLKLYGNVSSKWPQFRETHNHKK